ncbi:odorant receptor 67a-like isoform X1 [Camponotus floridanus]|uniref:odorant receptor 67a-like isoform X1 n=2 Tax=Camponotus floridanus TaxID=104421 RepID=UPI0009716724|nr:odorant receptor 67a-like isoform X1 [Camponotus floridanus]
MDIQKVNPLNVRLNMISGNLLPMTAKNLSFPVLWRIYSFLVWSLAIVQTCITIPGCMYVPKEKALKDSLIAIVVTIEVVFLVVQIHARRELMQRLIQKLNNLLRIEDKMMESVVMETLKPMMTPLRFYWMAGIVSIIIWSGVPFTLIFRRDTFFYVDFRMPIAYTKEPFSTSIFVIGSFSIMISSMYTFTRKVSVDSYMINLILLITAQYKYIALKLSMIFDDDISQTNHDSSNKRKHYSKNYYTEKQMKSLCQHHNAVIRVTLILRKLLSLNFSLIYVISILRFCGIAIMMISIPSTTLLEGSLIVMYASGGIVQLYIICSCVQQLLDASIEITDQAFHEQWYRFGASIKRTFMFMVMANNLELKLSTFEKYNLSLSSFMTILNQSYSVAIILFKTS